jgi:hypothetical protein
VKKSMVFGKRDIEGYAEDLGERGRQEASKAGKGEGRGILTGRGCRWKRRDTFPLQGPAF